MKTKLIFIAMALILAVGTASAYIPTIEADTIFKGFDNGAVTGIVFANEGKSVIVMHDAQPVEIDIETHKIVREFEAVPNPKAANPDMKFIKSLNYLIATIKSLEIDGKKDFIGSVIWDYHTGKIIKTMRTTYFINNDDLTYMWNGSTHWNYGNEYIYKYDFSNFQKKDSLLLSGGLAGNGNTLWNIPVILSNSNKIIFAVKIVRMGNNGKDTDYYGCGLYMLDLSKKAYEEIKFSNSSHYDQSEITQMLITETGKYLIIYSKTYINVRKVYIFDSNQNNILTLNFDDFKLLTGDDKIYQVGIVSPFSDDHMIINFYTSNGYKMACFNITNNKIYKYLGFLGSGIYDKETNKLALVNSKGVVALFGDEITSVKTPQKPQSLEIIYSNNQIEYFSDKSFVAEAQIYDLAGKLVSNLGSQEFVNGKNIIPVEQTLSVGIYFLSIENGTEQYSYKFLVE